MLDGEDFFERNQARPLGEPSHLALALRRQVARGIGRPRDGFGMTEQVEAHAGKLVR